MNARTLIAGNVALLLLAALPLTADTMKFSARSGSKMRIEGTSNVHDWQVESSVISGSLEVGTGFPAEPGQAGTPGKIEAKGDVFIPVRSLTSKEKDGSHYSDAMDEIMWGKLLVATSPKILYHLTELTLKEAAKSKDAPNVFEAKGDLVVAGVTNKSTMTVNITPLADKKLKVAGSTAIKMTDFKIEPPAPKIALGLIKTGDDVKLIFEWILAPAKAPAAK
jgi:hypothetical protein